ncbi:hypothetical protein [Deinococcus arenicola]|uniref:Uncharacterized protein n=1 Tax=Deinococcus arenicola TaxID=2994950 RepID=A0ABU4DN66_9DEIO|nr:hypothetical protein [Deinococcus sp. ZS9-10]MDV6373881.1 hypothetical protein [Deinococcus sp. ZS9-10]
MKPDDSIHQARLKASLPAALERIATTQDVYAALWCERWPADLAARNPEVARELNTVLTATDSALR